MDVVLVCIRWYAAYLLSYRHIEEMMAERVVSVDPSSINRWAIRFLPLIEKRSHPAKRPVGGNWFMDEMYIKVKGIWKYLYRAVDEAGKTVDFLLAAKRNTAAARCVFDKAMHDNGVPGKVTVDKSGANKAARNVLTGIELMHMIRKALFSIAGGDKISFAGQFYAFAGQNRPA